MKATGLFFLCGRSSIVRGVSPTDGNVVDWLFPVLSRDGRGVQKVNAYWRGTDAAKFVEEHAEKLKAGQALTLELDRLRPDGDAIKANVVSCALAPDRWPVKPAETVPPTAATPAA